MGVDKMTNRGGLCEKIRKKGMNEHRGSIFHFSVGYENKHSPPSLFFVPELGYVRNA